MVDELTTYRYLLAKLIALSTCLDLYLSWVSWKLNVESPGYSLLSLI